VYSNNTHSAQELRQESKKNVYFKGTSCAKCLETKWKACLKKKVVVGKVLLRLNYLKKSWKCMWD
jgi:hypothetical protein